MTPDDSINFDRLATAMTRIADALMELARIETEKFRKQYPVEEPKRAAEIIRTESDKREQYSDDASAEWFSETEQATPATRFRERFEKEHPGKSTEKLQPKKRSVTPVHPGDKPLTQ